MKDKYEVRVTFDGVITKTVHAISEVDAVAHMRDEIAGWLFNVNVDFDHVEKKVTKLTWRDEEDFASILLVWGEPSYERFNSPVWILGEDKGLILDKTDLVGFTVCHKNKIFDVWHDGHFVDYGEDYYQAYFDYVSERELLEK